MGPGLGPELGPEVSRTGPSLPDRGRQGLSPGVSLVLSQGALPWTKANRPGQQGSDNAGGTGDGVQGQEPPPCEVEAACVAVGPIRPKGCLDCQGNSPPHLIPTGSCVAQCPATAATGMTPATDQHLPAKVLCVHTAQTPAPGRPRN